jgi:hypothetical protein
MKKVIVSLFILASFGKLFSQTTLEEFNFITKGYKIQLESGLDMKKGYSLSTLTDFLSLDFGNDEKSGRRGMVFKALIRGSETKPCAIMAIYERRLNGKAQYQEYYCIPMPLSDDTLWDKTLEQLNANFNNDNAKQVYSAMLWAMMKFASIQSGR